MTDDELWQAFSGCVLPAAMWTHREHLRVAWMLSRDHELDEAHVLMRAGIIRLNASHGLVESVTRGYHETITRAWLVLIRHLIHRIESVDTTSERFVERCATELGAGSLLRHYSRERLMSVRARAVFVEPDLAPLPVVA